MRYNKTDSFIIHTKTEDFCQDISKDLEKRFHKSNYFLERTLPMGKSKNVLSLIKHELGAVIMKEFVGVYAERF